MEDHTNISRRNALAIGVAGVAATAMPAAGAAAGVSRRKQVVRTALIIIDPYNDFISEGGKRWPLVKPVAQRVGTVGNMKRLLETARAGDAWVYYSLHHRPRPGDYEGWLHPNPSHAGIRDSQVFAEGTWGGEIADAFKPQTGQGSREVLCQEHWTTGGFNTTDMDFLLRARGIEHIVICGLLSSTCAEMTGRHGVELGYRVTMVTDAVADMSEEAHRVAVEINYPRFSHSVVTTDQAIEILRDA